jgi:GTP-binding protein
VGKSTLFNRLIGERRAIVQDEPGTTRDRLYGDAEWNGREFVVVDTAGLEVAPESEIERHVQDQVRQAIAEADVVLLLTDVRAGPMAVDFDLADQLRRARKPTVLAVNKAEGPKHGLNTAEFYRLGIGDPIPVSGLQGTGTGDVLDAVVDLLPPAEEEPEEALLPRIAIIGRPNVGKSALLNRIVGFERSVVSATPGTTRDTIDSVVDVNGRPVLLVDTAGIRRRGRIEAGIEKFSVLRSIRAVNRADVALLLLDAQEGPTAQDAHVAAYANDAYKGVVVAMNKWDLIEDKTTFTIKEHESVVKEALKFLPNPPLIFISALTGQRALKTLEMALEVYDERRKRIPTAKLNQLFSRAQFDRSPGSVRGRKLRIYYATQAEAEPPTFVLFVNDPKLLHFSYERYLLNRVRDEFGFAGTPIKLVFRPKEAQKER